MKQFQIDKADPSCFRVLNTELTHSTDVDKAADGVVFKVERFAFTANNLTYYMVGEKLGYWQFFPALDNDDEQRWGVIPVWGVGQVIHSNNDAVEIGSRYFGYFPPADYLEMSKVKISHHNLIDCSAHRLKLPQGYNMYRPLPSLPAKTNDDFVSKQRTQENLQMLLWPLFATSYCLYEVVLHVPEPHRKQLLVLSASSKTSLGLAFALHRAGIKATGITSQKRVEALKSLGIYDAVMSYEQLATLQQQPTIVVDMSGNAQVKTTIKEQLGDHLTKYINVGLTHWQDSEPTNDGDAFFFAPTHIQQRMSEIGAAEYQKQSSEFVFSAITWSSSWLNIKECEGLNALNDDLLEHQQGQIPINEGRIYTL